MLCGLLKPDAGSGTCLGYDIIRETDAIKRHVGYMTQRFTFYEDLTIRENLDFVARIYGLDRRRQRVDAALERLGLRRPPQSAGRRTLGRLEAAPGAGRVHAARAAAAAARRADRRRRSQGAARFLGRDPRLAAQGLTVLVTTHYMDEAERCDRIVYIAYGRLLTRGTVREVIAEAGLTPGRCRAAVTARASPHARRIERQARRRAGRGLRRRRCTSAGATRRRSKRAIAPYRSDPSSTWQRPSPVSRTYSST